MLFGILLPLVRKGYWIETSCVGRKDFSVLSLAGQPFVLSLQISYRLVDNFILNHCEDDMLCGEFASAFLYSTCEASVHYLPFSCVVLRLCI